MLDFLTLVAQIAEEPGVPHMPDEPHGPGAPHALDALPDLCGDFTAPLVTERRTDTIAVFEMIVAIGHDPELGPVKGLLDQRLARLLMPCVGLEEAVLTVTAAMQGLVLSALSSVAPDQARDPERLRGAVSDLIRRYRPALWPDPHLPRVPGTGLRAVSPSSAGEPPRTRCGFEELLASHSPSVAGQGGSLIAASQKR
ncbi:hypothetical protein AB0H92_20025 [Streptomyces phaeochromogenes]|uniref:hypothetical protein n=1 Tax=Streptomyces phaeochromogenes TaxID=1923 RepID=UPI0033D932C4